MGRLLLIGLIVISLFIVSCSQNQKSSDILDKLQTTTLNYNADYSKQHTYRSYGGGSGSTDYLEISAISVEVKNNAVVSYTLVKTFDGHPFGPAELQERNYKKYYNKTIAAMCTEKFISVIKCSASEAPKPPELGTDLIGCRATLNSDGKVECLCNNDKVLIDSKAGFACSEKINTAGMTLNYGNAVYLPETQKGFCYYYASDTKNGMHWAFECSNKPVLTPINSYGIKDLSNATCSYYGSGGCFCDFSPKATVSECVTEIPINFDTEIKAEIINYLNKITISKVSEEATSFGNCYKFDYNYLEHVFCFDSSDSLMFAQWGSNITKKNNVKVDFTKIERLVK